MLTGSLDSFVVPDKHRYKTAMAFVVEVLREGVLTGAISEGTPLRQDDLAAKFGLSRMPIRDAIRHLEAEGLVVYEPHKGATVATMTIDDIVEVYDMRIMAECTALRLAFSGIGAVQIAELHDTLHAMSTDDINIFRTANKRFYNLLFQTAKRPRLQALISTLHDSVERYLQLLITDSMHHTATLQAYLLLIETCAAGDCAAAEKILKKHLSATRDIVISYLRSRHTL